MPELPEVETTRRGIEPHLINRRISAIQVRDGRLRWPVDDAIHSAVGRKILTVKRRAKYLLIELEAAHIMIHLGMSGSLRICEPGLALRKHDHVAVTLEHDLQLRYHDPRRFGCWIWTVQPPLAHPLLSGLGPEPLGRGFHAAALEAACSGRRVAIKQVIMDARVVVGVGNIYACEALFAAGIAPDAPAGSIAAARLAILVTAIKRILRRSIRQGGTTLRDFLREDGNPGYFRQQLMVYDREGQPCYRCKAPVLRSVLGQRSTFYCPNCQPKELLKSRGCH